MSEDVICLVECPEGFNDFSILKEILGPGARAEVSEAQFAQMRQSNPTVVLVEKRLPIGSEAAKRMQVEKAEEDEAKAAIVAKHAKDAPPRRNKQTPGSNRIPDTKKGVTSAEMVHLPVTKEESDA